ncbi:Cytochrome c553 [Hydrocarboniphaga daqingensis]|uniref:Cytochrome c553 n=1 Tax=Hydrocarboniphaga daqingensis TaxID=490188 RepID=A0A1M5N1R3_9GAMM|nr:hypothetical protein [Hydrocarboniphaga daqingensis]SHG83498.1 Cytochrome c553 [Hydrocarboniphaga daqingensis]
MAAPRGSTSTRVGLIQCVALIAGVALVVFAQPGRAESSPPSPLAQMCRTCHAEAQAEFAFGASLDSLDANTIFDRLRVYRSRSDDGSVMPRFARGMSDQTMQQLAAELGRSAP